MLRGHAMAQWMDTIARETLVMTNFSMPNL